MYNDAFNDGYQNALEMQELRILREYENYLVSEENLRLAEKEIQRLKLLNNQ